MLPPLLMMVMMMMMLLVILQEKKGIPGGFDKQMFEDKEKRILVRQVTALSQDDEVYADVGFIPLPVQRIISESSGAEYTFDLNDP